MTTDLKNALIIFGSLTLLVMIVLRFTRNQQAIRDRIKYPMIAIYLLAVALDLLYGFGFSLPATVEPYYFAFLYLAIAVLLIRLSIHFFYDYFLFHTKKYRAPRLLKEITSVVLFTLALMFILQQTLKIQVTTVLATSAIITVVLGLALQETLGNLFAGLALHLDPPYQEGDWVKITEIYGKVVEVTWRSTKLRTVNNDLIVFPNGQVAKEVVTNHTFPRIPHATSVFVGVAYSVPPNKVDSVVKEALLTVDNVTTDPSPDIRVNSFDDFTVKYQIKFFMKDYGLIEPTLAAVRKAFWYHFRRNGIEIPFPVRNVYLNQPKEVKTVREEELRQLSESLRGVYVFASLGDDELALIAEQLEEMHFAKDEVIIREGETGDSLFIIDEGEVEVFLMSLRGNRKSLGRLHAGEFFGEMALLMGGKRSASVEAITDVCLYKLDKDRFKEILAQKPKILDEISDVLSRRKDQLEDLLAQSSGPHSKVTVLDVREAQTRILSRIRNYFGL